MPRFEAVPVDELKKASEVSSRTLEKIKPYISHLAKLDRETGGKLTCEKGENLNTIRNHLKRAAIISGKNIKIRRSGNTLLFHLVGGRKRGRTKRT